MKITPLKLLIIGGVAVAIIIVLLGVLFCLKSRKKDIQSNPNGEKIDEEIIRNPDQTVTPAQTDFENEEEEDEVDIGCWSPEELYFLKAFSSYYKNNVTNSKNETIDRDAFLIAVETEIDSAIEAVGKLIEPASIDIYEVSNLSGLLDCRLKLLNELKVMNKIEDTAYFFTFKSYITGKKQIPAAFSLD